MSETFTIPEAEPATPVTIVADDSGLDPGAPYGRFSNGKPRKAPPKDSAGRRPKAAAAPKASAPRAAKRAEPDFRPVVEQAAGALSLILTGLGRRNRAFLADAATVQINAADGAHVLNEIAKINPVVERLLSVSAPAVPYMLLGNFLFTLGTQFAANHGKAIPIPGVSVLDPEELAQGMERQMRKASEQQAEQQAKQATPGAAEHSYTAA